MGDQIAIGGIGVMTEPLDHLGRVLAMQHLALAELGLHPPHVDDHSAMQRPMSAQLGIAVADHQAVLAGEMPLGGTQQFAQLAEPPATAGCRDQPVCQSQDPAMLTVDEEMPENWDVSTHAVGRSLARMMGEPSSSAGSRGGQSFVSRSTTPGGVCMATRCPPRISGGMGATGARCAVKPSLIPIPSSPTAAARSVLGLRREGRSPWAKSEQPGEADHGIPLGSGFSGL